MHGRLKVKTSAQIEAENLAKREKKLKYFQHIVKQIFDLRQNQRNYCNAIDNSNKEPGESDGETDCNDQFSNKLNEILLPLLKLTAEVLISSPDIFTFWNIRREILLEIKHELR